MTGTTSPHSDSPLAWVGGYTIDGGADTGISLLTQDPTGALEVHGRAMADSPSWIALHPRVPVLYAAQENIGTIAAFAVDDTALQPLGTAAAGPILCHLLVRNEYLIGCCYGDGTVLRVDLAADGGLGEITPAVPSFDPHAAAGERRSRAHCAAALEDDLILTVDLGHDQLRLFSTAAGLEQIGTITLPMGCGPRHLLVHSASRVSVITEYSCQVITVECAQDGQWHVVAAVALLEGETPADAAGAELTAADDGSVLYAGVRGPDLIITLDARASRVIGRTPSGAHGPRHHRQIGDQLLVANQLSNEINMLQIDPSTHIPGAVVDRIASPAPSCLLPTGLASQ